MRSKLGIRINNVLFSSCRLLLGGFCNTTSVHYGVRTNHDPTHNVRIIFPEESTDAVIYVTVVVVFYAAIILILVGTNIKRFKKRNDDECNGKGKRHLVVYVDNKERIVQQTNNNGNLDPGGNNMATTL
ncbi:uncharacterized protein LOC111621880 [Centruroides sculpturatus]|uniref:uncharacterized protein LOC111621880 n=1 Tax=Centruroides sculpturatus TaxID=218467 RepID=UPI000C6D6092|nr:uncharacterized protein LOC111621880 [Centruroides sculpturatus]